MDTVIKVCATKKERGLGVTFSRIRRITGY